MRIALICLVTLFSQTLLAERVNEPFLESASANSWADVHEYEAAVSRIERNAREHCVGVLRVSEFTSKRECRLRRYGEDTIPYCVTTVRAYFNCPDAVL